MFTKPTLKTALALATGLLMLTGCDNDDDDGPGTQQPSAPGDSYPSGTVHCIEGGTAVVEVLNPETGKTWMDRNLGASQVATSSTDEAAYGDLYQWGRFSDGHQCRNSTTTTEQAESPSANHSSFIIEHLNWLNENNSDLWQGVDGINNPCPEGYRLPTWSEWFTEYQSWSTPNAEGAFESILKITLAGHRHRTSGDLTGVGTDGRYWSRQVAISADYLEINAVNASTNTRRRSFGHSVRCIKD